MTLASGLREDGGNAANNICVQAEWRAASELRRVGPPISRGPSPAASGGCRRTKASARTVNAVSRRRHALLLATCESCDRNGALLPASERLSRTRRVRGGSRKTQVMTRLVSFVLLCSFGGCATVAPYQRERLARPDMELGGNSDAKAGEEHATAYREGSSGGLGSR